MGESFAMNIPVICNSGVGDNDEIVSRFNAGWVISAMNEQHFIEAAQKVLTYRQGDSGSIRDKSESLFSLKTGITLYQKVYLHLLSRS
jgi:glycosyltransferase involved in cell wall biosynthesis